MSCESSSTLRDFARGALDGAVAERVAAHLETCERCAAALDAIDPQWAAIKSGYVPRRASEAVRSRVRWSTRAARRSGPRLVAAAIAAGVVVALAIGLATARRVPSLAQLALRTHEALAAGTLGLDVTGEPATVAWALSRRLGATLQLPPLPGAGLRLVGARFLDAGDQPAATLVYRQGDETVSLTVAPREAVSVEGGAVETFRAQRFLVDTRDGRSVLQWTHGDLSYALVAGGAAQAREGCAACHGPRSGLSTVDDFVHPD